MTNSHILVGKYDYHEPSSVVEAVSLLQKYGEKARILAGGTDLLVQMKMERHDPSHVISLGAIQDMDYITPHEGGLEIGARTSIRKISRNAIVQSLFPGLKEACESFSTTQIQIMGTLGGNLCNASPASDSAPPLITNDARAIIAGPDGTRSIPVEDFFLSPGKSALKSNELLQAVLIPWPAANTGCAFLKVSRVNADIAKVNVSATLVRDGDTIVSCRLAYGSVAPTPRRAKEAEAILQGQHFTEEIIAGAALTASGEMSPIDDPRSSAWYRREIVRVLAIDAITKAWERAEHASADIPASESNEEATENLTYGASVYVSSDEKVTISLKVNGKNYSVQASTNDLLLNVLREQLNLTGAKYGCGIGECSACTIELDGKPALACLVLAVSAQGRDIVTSEGISEPDGTINTLQEAFITHSAYQCGYCTPGIVMTAKGLLEESPSPSEDEVRSYMKGNLCRCTGYASIVRAVMSCADEQDDATE